LRIKNTTTHRVDFPEPEHLWSVPEGNVYAPLRESSVFRSLQLLLPRSSDDRFDQSLGEAHFYIVPGESMSRDARRGFARLKADLTKADEFPSRIELEFSSPVGGPPSQPKAYKTLTVDWALSVCDTVLICIDGKTGNAEAEAHRVLAPLQLVFRCQEQNVQAWLDYLQQRLKPRHRLSIVHPHIAVGRA
jgi:hypothetical protein